jgi:predicted nucleic acid-binding protein
VTVATSGYLLDNNIISILAQPGNARHAPVKQRFEALGDAPVFLPVIAIAEIEFGMVKTQTPDAAQQAAVRQFFVEYPLHLGIDDNTVEPYSLIRSQIWHDHATPRGKGSAHKEKQPEDLTERTSGKSLGIDERDLLIASTAAQYGLVLVTNDNNEGMKRIAQAAQKLELHGKPVQLRIELWP